MASGARAPWERKDKRHVHHEGPHHGLPAHQVHPWRHDQRRVGHEDLNPLRRRARAITCWEIWTVATAQAAEAAAEEEEDVAPSRGDAETKCVDSATASSISSSACSTGAGQPASRCSLSLASPSHATWHAGQKNTFCEEALPADLFLLELPAVATGVLPPPIPRHCSI